ncbi:hypothetical protein CEUSTIGMA_g9593.t1 [Chlamydomonas eustigma]|uniref:U2A'/phosphoprotein 32 family A C-terminal domain-containing protein n=1 Tax=Chlamydomonas eustigma TaxID=1157962 RepID=A0A250XGG1_9CHLO|nr:hypothetical protein CEUSTIGMA_g9593.t1 [Chlamydomonas eustigma]|eukprot:GAX82165.1 hypothetical protein CEUSTIGMA_g9593.t1 [Chlamydomonas eustigma]
MRALRLLLKPVILYHLLNMLVRSSSSSGRTEESIKSISQRFDLEIVFRLSLASKKLNGIACLEPCINLTDLDLSDNDITKIEGLGTLTELRRLNLSSNRIQKVENISELKKLESLKLQGNQISMSGLNISELCQLTALKALYFQNLDRTFPCPACSDKTYRNTILSKMPQLTNFDGERCPFSINYAAVSEEVRGFQLNPPPPRVVVIPDIEPWLKLESDDASSTSATTGTQELVTPEFVTKAEDVNKRLDNCHALAEVLREEISKCLSLLENQMPTPD